MNPLLPMQGPGVVNNSTKPLINNPHLPAPSHMINSQWTALNTNPDLQQTLCKAEAAGHLTQEQLQSFGAYTKNSASTYTMFQLELQAVKQQQITHQQQQQQHQHLDHDKPPPSQLYLQMSNICNGFVNSTLPSSQAPIQISLPSNRFQATPQSSMSPPPGVPQRITDHISLMNSDPHLTQRIAQLRQIHDVLKNPNLPPSECEAATLAVQELCDAVASRMNLLGLHQTNPNSNSNSSSSPSVGWLSNLSTSWLSQPTTASKQSIACPTLGCLSMSTTDDV
ncbi:expressed protein [Phakopsora pachyrhizi]|uniref:Expressed protein n=1 Tax=Phakopsora pachyrhizi TaxID=170000 RepID=A0AAV0B2A9_PHAPC|nr:expressed protein [Phakopsora pachyrhizi]